jgi:nucleotide-binding universal stress UspA family protein
MSVLVAISEQKQSHGVVEVAYDLATAYRDQLVVLHVIPDQEFEEHKTSIESIPDFESFSLTQGESSAARYGSRVVSKVLDEFDSETVEYRGRIGDPDAEILAEAESIDPRFLVVGCRQRTPVGKAILGSTTQHVLLNATQPVVTVRVS